MQGFSLKFNCYTWAARRTDRDYIKRMACIQSHDSSHDAITRSWWHHTRDMKYESVSYIPGCIRRVDGQHQDVLPTKASLPPPPLYSLVPRLPTIQFLITSCLCKSAGGGGGGQESTSNVIVYLGRQSGKEPLNKGACFTHTFFTLNNEGKLFHLINVQNSNAQIHCKKCLKHTLSFKGPSPTLST